MTFDAGSKAREHCLTVWRTMAILTCGDIAVLLRMAVDTAESSVFFRAIDQSGIRALMTSGTDDVFNLRTVLNIDRRMHGVTPDTTAVVLKGYVRLSMTLGAVWDIAMLGVVATAATQVCMGAWVLYQFLPLRFMAFSTIGLKLV